MSTVSTDALIWNPGLGLWRRNSSGHTRQVATLPEVHSGVESAVKLHGLLQLGLLDDHTLASAIQGLLNLQVTTGPRAGCFRWYAEEDEPIDTNAAFFIGLALQLLALGHPQRVPGALREPLNTAFDRLNHWLLREVEVESAVYPNKHLGDLVCAWLGHELLDRPVPAVLGDAFSAALTYWESDYWGWGEHQSDVYAGVLLTEFSALLLFARHLPPALASHARRLARQLLALDDAYGSGPRVPQIRGYDFMAAPARVPFRAEVGPWPGDADEAWLDRRAVRRYMVLPFGPLFASRGWADLFPPPEPAPAPGLSLTVPLSRHVQARAWIGRNLRTGVLTQWPILPGAEHQAWGLSWQTFPAAFWRPAGDWGFLRFTSRCGDDLRAHPALDKARAYLANALGPGEPPPVGRTAAAQHLTNWIALRAHPRIGPPWDELSDGFWLPELSVQPRIELDTAPWSTLLLDYPDEAVRLHHFNFDAPAPTPVLTNGSGGYRWTVVAAADLNTSLPLRLWALTVGPAPAVPPVCRREGERLDVSWPEAGWLKVTLTLPRE